MLGPAETTATSASTPARPTGTGGGTPTGQGSKTRPRETLAGSGALAEGTAGAASPGVKDTGAREKAGTEGIETGTTNQANPGGAFSWLTSPEKNCHSLAGYSRKLAGGVHSS